VSLDQRFIEFSSHLTMWSTFMTDRCTFMDFKTETVIHRHYKGWKSKNVIYTYRMT